MNLLDDIRDLNRRATLALLALAGIVGVWAATAPLSGAVVAPGVVAVESNLKRVQHKAGGSIAEIRVRDGDRVREGDVLFRLDAGQARAALNVFTVQWASLKAREARLLAERDGADRMTLPPELAAVAADADAAQAIEGEKSLFASRRLAHQKQEAQLGERLEQLAKESQTMVALSQARAQETQLLSKELKGLEQLFHRGYATLPRLVAKQRDMTRLQAERLQFATDAERVKDRAGEVELEIAKRQSEHLTAVVDALRDVQVKLAEVDEKRLTARDTLARLDVRAPRDGVVLGSTLHTIGGVIGAGETVMHIVPENDPLVVEARVAPREIDQVSVGAPATVKLLAGNRRTVSDLEGKVLHVSADIARDENGNEGFFVVRISIDRDDVAKRSGFAPQAGMTAEAFIKTGDRTALAYLLQPVTDQLDRAMRER